MPLEQLFLSGGRGKKETLFPLLGEKQRCCGFSPEHLNDAVDRLFKLRVCFYFFEKNILYFFYCLSVEFVVNDEYEFGINVDAGVVFLCHFFGVFWVRLCVIY